MYFICVHNYVGCIVQKLKSIKCPGLCTWKLQLCMTQVHSNASAELCEALSDCVLTVLNVTRWVQAFGSGHVLAADMNHSRHFLSVQTQT
jgi:hypothetical protein